MLIQYTRVVNSVNYLELIIQFDIGINVFFLKKKLQDVDKIKIWAIEGYCRIVAPHNIVFVQYMTVVNLSKCAALIISFNTISYTIQSFIHEKLQEMDKIGAV